MRMSLPSSARLRKSCLSFFESASASRFASAHFKPRLRLGPLLLHSKPSADPDKTHTAHSRTVTQQTHTPHMSGRKGKAGGGRRRASKRKVTELVSDDEEQKVEVKVEEQQPQQTEQMDDTSINLISPETVTVAAAPAAAAAAAGLAVGSTESQSASDSSTFEGSPTIPAASDRETRSASDTKKQKTVSRQCFGALAALTSAPLHSTLVPLWFSMLLFCSVGRCPLHGGFVRRALPSFQSHSARRAAVWRGQSRSFHSPSPERSTLVCSRALVIVFAFFCCKVMDAQVNVGMISRSSTPPISPSKQQPPSKLIMIKPEPAPSTSVSAALVHCGHSRSLDLLLSICSPHL